MNDGIKMSLRVDFDVATRPNDDQILTQMGTSRRNPNCRRKSGRYRTMKSVSPAGPVRPLLPNGNA